MKIYINYKRLSTANVDVANDIAEYAYPQTIEQCWKDLDRKLVCEHITQTQYDEIKSQVTFFYTDEAE